MKLFHFLSGAAGDFPVSCEWISQEIKHQYGQDRKTYYTVCFHQLLWHADRWDRTRPVAAMGPLWWRWSHVLSCANCSDLLVLEVFAVSLLPSLVTDIQMDKEGDVNAEEQLFNSYDSLHLHLSVCWKKLNWPFDTTLRMPEYEKWVKRREEKYDFKGVWGAEVRRHDVSERVENEGLSQKRGDRQEGKVRCSSMWLVFVITL